MGSGLAKRAMIVDATNALFKSQRVVVETHINMHRAAHAAAPERVKLAAQLRQRDAVNNALIAVGIVKEVYPLEFS